MKPLVIIPCGAAKRDTPQPAGDLYVGSYFKACKNYALSVTDPSRVLILSAKHGLVPLPKVLAPYDTTFGQPGCITQPQIAQQARDMGLLNEPSVYIAAGKRYAAMVRPIWPHAINVLEGTTGMGYQIQRLNLLAKGTR